VLKKWLNLKSKDLDFGADEDEEEDDGSDIDEEGWPQFPLLRRDPFSFYRPNITSFSLSLSQHVSLDVLFLRELRLRRRQPSPAGRRRRSDHR
jgi:hypothetical protein